MINGNSFCRWKEGERGSAGCLLDAIWRKGGERREASLALQGAIGLPYEAEKYLRKKKGRYDYRAGFWVVFGRECSGIIPPFIKEFSYRMAKDIAGGNTGVFVNCRELHQKDFDLLVGRGLPRLSGKLYSVEISGSVIDDTTGKNLCGLGKLAPTIEKVKRGFGMHVPEETS